MPKSTVRNESETDRAPPLRPDHDQEVALQEEDSEVGTPAAGLSLLRIEWLDARRVPGSESLQKRIRYFFPPNGGVLTVTGDHDGVFRKIEQTRFDGGKNLAAIATWQIGPADGIAKQRIARH